MIEIVLAATGVALPIAFLASAFAVAWRTNKLENEKKIPVPNFPRKQRVIAGTVLSITLTAIIPFSFQIEFTNLK